MVSDTFTFDPIRAAASGGSVRGVGGRGCVLGGLSRAPPHDPRRAPIPSAPLQHAGRTPPSEEMNWRHAPPDAPRPPGASVVPLLLLLVLVPPGRGCVFSFHPLSTTFSMAIDELTQHLLHDYPVSMPSNLEPDAWCAELWRIHFLAAELGHMGGVAGTALQPFVANVATQVQFIKECAITDPMSCVGRERTNVSRMLSALNSHLVALRSKMMRQAGPVDFSNCTPVRCQPAAPALLPAPLGLPQPGFSSQKQPGTQASGAGSLHQNHLPVLLLLVPILGSLAFVWQRQRRLGGQDPRSHGRSRCSGFCTRAASTGAGRGRRSRTLHFTRHSRQPSGGWNRPHLSTDCRAEP